MNPKNYYGFDDWQDVGYQFGVDIGQEPEYVYAVYSTPYYEGAATVVFFRDCSWKQSEGTHCSCYGLEEEGWNPEIIDLDAHKAARKDGKRLILASDSEHDYPDATPEAFDAWFDWAIAKTGM